jgi:hypothetical protein
LLLNQEQIGRGLVSIVYASFNQKIWYLEMENTVNVPGAPWWKHGFVWMIIAGPAIVVVAGFVTLYLAMSRPNEIITEETYRPQRQSDQSIEASRKDSSFAPAVQGRNHAATGLVPAAK